MQSKKGIIGLLRAGMYVCMYVCMVLSELNAKGNSLNNKYFNSTVTNIGLVSRIYECKPSLTSPLLAAYASQQNKLPISVKPAAPLLLKSCDQPSTSCATLNIKGSISITGCKDIAITVGSLADITVSGAVFIFIPAEGSFTINNTVYTTSPIPGLTIRQNDKLTVQISCFDRIFGQLNGVDITDITLNVQNDIVISNNISSGNYGVSIEVATIVSTNGSITIEGNQGPSYGAFIYDPGSEEGNKSFNLIKAAGDISISNNSATDSTSGQGVSIDHTTMETTGSGAIITIEGNQGAFSGARISAESVIKSLGNISVLNNIATNSDGIGFGFTDISSTVKTGGDFIINVDTTDPTLNQNFDSSAIAITNLAGTALPFSSFAVTVNGTSYLDYAGIPDNAVVLNAKNQS